MDGNDNKEEKTREVANNRMYHFGCNKDVICCDEWVMLVDISFFILSTCLTTLSSCVLMGDDTEDGKDNYM